MPAATSLSAVALAAMLRRLRDPMPLFRMLELVAEEAGDALHAASVSISELDLTHDTVQTIINVGILGPGEQRWPVDEVYAISDFGKLSRVVLDLIPWTSSIDDPLCDAQEADLLVALGKGAALGAPIVVDGVIWGEFYATRHRGRSAFTVEDIAYVEVLMTILGAAISRALLDEARSVDTAVS